MVENFSLCHLYQKQIEASPSTSCLEQEVYHGLIGKEICLKSILDASSGWKTHSTEEKVIENWKNLLTLALLAHLSGSDPQPLIPEIRHLLVEPWNEHSQYIGAMSALTHFCLGLPIPELVPTLLEGGAALIDLNEQCPWQSLPYMPCHAEFGCLLALLALLTNQEQLKAPVEGLTNWQLNTLDAQFFPFNGLFSKERDGTLSENLMWNFLLFCSSAQLTRQGSFQAVAQALLCHIDELAKKTEFKVPSLMVLIEKVLQQRPTVPAALFQQPEYIYDPSTALMGRRFPSSEVVCTLHGGHTGLGCFRLKELEVVSYGPQYLPLEECRGFGIEGNQLSDQGLRKPVMHLKPQGFSLKGCVRMIDQPLPLSSSSFHLGQWRGIWFEAEQEVKEKQLKIQTSFLGFNGWESVAFSFFIKAKVCRINPEISLYPRTFERYEGQAHPLLLEGQASSFKLDCSMNSCRMQVVPLGGVSFWGADFLVAYILDSNQRHYTWQISPISIS